VFRNLPLLNAQSKGTDVRITKATAMAVNMAKDSVVARAADDILRTVSGDDLRGLVPKKNVALAVGNIYPERFKIFENINEGEWEGFQGAIVIFLLDSSGFVYIRGLFHFFDTSALGWKLRLQITLEQVTRN